MHRTRVMSVLAATVMLTACEAPDRDPAGPDVPATPEATEPDVPAEQPTPDERRAWVAVEDGNALALVDLDAGEIVEEHPVPGAPHNLVVAADGTVAAALYDTTELAILRDGELDTVELGGSPHDVKATHEGFVVANEIADRVDVVDHDAEHVTSVELPAQPHDTAVVPDGSVAWVTMNDTDELAVIDLDEAEVVEVVTTGQSPHNILFAPDGETFWVTDWEGPVHAFSADGELLDSFPVGVEAHHLAFTPDGAEVWVTDHHTEEIYVFDVEAREHVADIAVPGMPHHVNITADGELAVVADHTNGTAVVYDVAAREQVDTIEVGPGPHGVWVVP